MITITWFCLLLAASTAASVCSTDHYKRYGDECTCSDVCLDNTHCQLNQTGGYSCQCLPCLVYDPVLRQCVRPPPPTTAPPVTTAAPTTTTKAPTTTTKEPICTKHLVADIYFLADSSNSIYPVGWGRELAFITNTTKAFTLGPSDVQVAFGIFSTRFQHIIDLDRYRDHADFAADVLDTPQLRELTYTYDALDAISREGYLTSPARGARAGVTKVLIVITDGQSQNITRTIAAADDLKKENITILSIGVGVNNMVELQGIASRPQAVFSVKNFGALDSIRDQITQTVCEAPINPDPPCDPSVQLDLVFAVDDSSNIALDVFERNFEFVGNVIHGFSLGETGTKVGLLTFSTSPQSVFPLISSVDQVYQTLLNVPYENGTRNTHLALDYTRQFFSPDFGARPQAKKVVIVLTDGVSSDPEKTLEAASRLKASGAGLIALGIEGADQQELTQLASTPAYSFQVASYDSLASLAGTVVNLACQDPVRTTAAPETTTTTPAPTTTEAVHCDPGYVPNPSNPSECKEISCEDLVRADIYFLADSSNSIYPVGWGRELAFITNTIKAFKLGPKDVQVAFGIFSTRFQHIIDLTQYTNHADFTAAVLSTPQLQELTYTYDALNAINREGYLTSVIHGSRPGVPKVLVVITDGQSQNITRTLEEAEALREQNISILAVGVGLTNQVELQGLASSPDSVFGVKNFGALDSIRGRITQHICDAPITPDPPCDNPDELDLVILVDASSSIGREIFDRNFEFVYSVIRGFTLGEASTKVALETFSTSAQPVFRLTASTDLILQSLLNVPFVDGSSNAHLALQSARDLLSPAFGGRAGARKAVVLITNRVSTDPAAAFRVANELKAQGVNIFTLGIQPTADSLELTGLASRVPYNFPVPNYDTLVLFASTVAQVICEAPPPPTPGKFKFFGL
ncbi:hypothetical protein BsWGS_25854 [Bradybaena similaris]